VTSPSSLTAITINGYHDLHHNWRKGLTRRRPRRVKRKLSSNWFDESVFGECVQTKLEPTRWRNVVSHQTPELTWIMLAAMVRLILSSVIASVIAVTSTMATARSRHQDPPKTYSPQTNFYHPASDANDVYVGGTFAGSDPDPNIRGALIREFGRRGL
jgi:hypothetical protein